MAEDVEEKPETNDASQNSQHQNAWKASPIELACNYHGDTRRLGLLIPMIAGASPKEHSERMVGNADIATQ